VECCSGSLVGNLNSKADSTPASIPDKLNTPAMCIDDGLGDYEPHSFSSLLTRIMWLKYGLSHGICDARSVIEDLSGLHTGHRVSALGEEAAKVLLGHASTSTTEIYLLEEVQEAMKVAKVLSS
jgi:hypothetical protein